MSKVTGISHAAFKCKDLDASLHYYKDVLGGGSSIFMFLVLAVRQVLGRN